MAERSLVARIANRLGSEAGEARLLGGSFVKRRIYAALARPECTVRVAGAGPVTVRPKGTDMASFRRVFASGD